MSLITRPVQAEVQFARPQRDGILRQAYRDTKVFSSLAHSKSVTVALTELGWKCGYLLNQDFLAQHKETALSIFSQETDIEMHQLEKLKGWNRGLVVRGNIRSSLIIDQSIFLIFLFLNNPCTFQTTSLRLTGLGEPENLDFRLGCFCNIENDRYDLPPAGITPQAFLNFCAVNRFSHTALHSPYISLMKCLQRSADFDHIVILGIGIIERVLFSRRERAGCDRIVRSLKLAMGSAFGVDIEEDFRAAYKDRNDISHGKEMTGIWLANSVYYSEKFPARIDEFRIRSATTVLYVAIWLLRQRILAEGRIR